jgi:KDO2-lipid IV(A) lauroyltransferase
MHLETITESPKEMQWGEITERHTKMLEKVIKNRPEQWIWSHKRWKREVPENIGKLREEQKAKFEERFGK